MGREGFEPSKAVPADLQSVPFGHSGICPLKPMRSDSPVNPKTIPMKHCVLFQIKYQAFTMNKFIVGNAVFIELLTIQ